MRIAVLQLNPVVGDLAGNAELILSAAREAAEAGAELAVAPELAICGYPPKDLLLRDGFVASCDRAIENLARALPPGLGLIVGHPTERLSPCGGVTNAASLLEHGEIVQTIGKQLLPNYDVFDERRYFRPAGPTGPILFRGVRMGLHVWEDAWFGQPDTFYHCPTEQHVDPVQALAVAGVDVLINISASPFEVGKRARREQIFGQHAARAGRPLLMVNQVGGNDDLVFDGQSLYCDERGRARWCGAAFAAQVCVLEVEIPTQNAPLSPSVGTLLPGSQRELTSTEQLLDALILGLRDYVRKSGFTDCVLGLSGGIDSAVACYIATQAVGAEHVHGLLMPSRYSSEHSVTDARELAVRLGVDWSLVPIDGVHQAYEQTTTVSADLLSQPGGLADQNLQARIRGALVMIRSNHHGWMAIATGNKSELAMGYCTLYGDMAGGFAVLCDVYKKDVYALARHINVQREQREVIPQATIDKRPSAELAPNQFDQDSLPDYDVLDGILEGLIDRDLSAAEVASRFHGDVVRWVMTRLDRNEFKRRQMPPGIKLSRRAFGSGRRMPMAARLTEPTWPVPTNPD